MNKNPFKNLFGNSEAGKESLRKIEDLIVNVQAATDIVKVNVQLSEASLVAAQSNQVVTAELIKAITSLVEAVGNVSKEIKSQTELLTTFYVMYDEMLYHIEQTSAPKAKTAASGGTMFDLKGKTPPKGDSSN